MDRPCKSKWKNTLMIGPCQEHQAKLWCPKGTLLYRKDIGQVLIILKMNFVVKITYLYRKLKFKLQIQCRETPVKREHQTLWWIQVLQVSLIPIIKITAIDKVLPKEEETIANTVKIPSMPPYMIDFKWSDNLNFSSSYYYVGIFILTSLWFII